MGLNQYSMHSCVSTRQVIITERKKVQRPINIHRADPVSQQVLTHIDEKYNLRGRVKTGAPVSVTLAPSLTEQLCQTQTHKGGNKLHFFHKINKISFSR